MKKILVISISLFMTAISAFADTGVWKTEYTTTDEGDGYTIYVCGTFSYAFAVADKFSIFGFSAPYDVYDLDENDETHVLITQYNNSGSVVKQDFIKMRLTQPEQNMLFCFDGDLTEEIKARLFNGLGSISVCISDVVGGTIYLKVNGFKKTIKKSSSSKRKTPKRTRR